MKIWKLAGATLSLLVLLAPTAATAGVEEPEIEDSCGSGSPNSLQTYTPEADICAGWFGATWDPVYDTSGAIVDYRLRELVTTVEMYGSVEDRVRHYHYEMAWSVGECRVSWFSKDYADSTEITRARYGIKCGTQPAEYFPVAPSDITYSGKRVSVTMAAERVPAPLRETLATGSILYLPRAYTLLQFQTTVDEFETTYSWDETSTEGGRSFVIGQDMPATP
ncbi:MAG: hypothetical protein ACRDH9_07260 [Actinomycetota bacterium]